MDEHAFLQWKEDVNDTYPGKGKALFQVKNFLLVQFYRVYQKFRPIILVHFFSSEQYHATESKFGSSLKCAPQMKLTFPGTNL